MELILGIVIGLGAFFIAETLYLIWATRDGNTVTIERRRKE